MFFIQYFMYYRTNKPGFFAIFSSLVLLFFYFVKEVISSFFSSLCSIYCIFSVTATSQLAFTCSKLTIETVEQGCEICFIVNFEHISHLCSSVSIVNFEHVIAGWDITRY